MAATAMIDPSARLRFGLSVTPSAAAYREILDQVDAAECGGLDLIGIQDHPYQRRFLDTFALIGDLLARTTRLRFFPNVANLQLRPPPMLAKAAASLDIMSGGRFELGLGVGGFPDAAAGMGVPPPARRELTGSLEEAIAIIRAALDVGPEKRVVRGPGPVYVVPGYPAGPPPAHRVQIWVGAMAPRALELIGRMADGWIPGAGVARIAAFGSLGARIDAAAEVAGRDPRSIRRIVNVAGEITAAPESRGPLVGPAAHWVEMLASWAIEHRIDAYIYWPPDTDLLHVERFAGEVVPGVREALHAMNPGA